MRKKQLLLFLIIYALMSSACPVNEDTGTEIIHVVVDMKIGETREVVLTNGETINCQLLSLTEERDVNRQAVRKSIITLAIDGEEITLVSGNYNLPITTGKVRVDCPATKGLLTRSDAGDKWGLSDNDARLRLWPKEGNLFPAGELAYPVKQRWLASDTQMGNEPVWVSGDEAYFDGDIYYHSGVDFAGAEQKVEVLAIVTGKIVYAHGELDPDYSEEEVGEDPPDDIVILLDSRKLDFLYAHLDSVDVEVGDLVEAGDVIGRMGKKGESGGFSHLHVELRRELTTGNYIIEDLYPFIWEAYISEYAPKVLAVARPHQVIDTGEIVTLDGSKSWTESGSINYQWTLSDGTTSNSSHVSLSYSQPGLYSEILKVTDESGNTDYDSTSVMVFDASDPGGYIPNINANYYPTFNLKKGESISFAVRSYGAVGEETWDFGDGSDPVTVSSDGGAGGSDSGGYAETTHTFDSAGYYLVKVERVEENGVSAVTYLDVLIGE